MLISMFIVFRELIEAGLIIGIVLAATEGIVGRGRWIADGIVVGLPTWGEELCDTTAARADERLFGQTLDVLIGDSSRPSLMVAAWLTLLPVMAALSPIVGRPRVGPAAAVAAVLSALLVTGASARAEDVPTLEFRQHRFEPNRVEVPAHVKFRLTVRNTDDTADEFESVDLNREKLVAPGQTITVFLGPLEPGEYKFFGDFHQDTAQGVIVAK
jgi:Cupredoxin-like domain